MSDFTPNKLDENKINLNSGKKFNKSDAFSSDDLNSIVEGILYNTNSSVVVDSELSGESENPVQNKVINEALDGKLDKVFTSSAVYGCNPTNQVMYLIGYGANPNVIAYRDANGNFQVNAPVKEKDCANKTYVDGKVKRYKHSIEAYAMTEDDPVDGTKEIWFTADILSNQSTSFTANNVPFIKGQNIINNDDYTVVTIFASGRTRDGKVWIDLPDADYMYMRYYIDDSDENIPFGDNVSEYEG